MSRRGGPVVGFFDGHGRGADAVDEGPGVIAGVAEELAHVFDALDHGLCP